jgi:hypothetical protein
MHVKANFNNASSLSSPSGFDLQGARLCHSRPAKHLSGTSPACPSKWLGRMDALQSKSRIEIQSFEYNDYISKFLTEKIFGLILKTTYITVRDIFNLNLGYETVVPVFLQGTTRPLFSQSNF